MALPPTKLTELHHVVSRFLSRRRASKKQLQQLAGKLNWACWVVYGGQTFLGWILDMLNLLQSPSAKVRLSAEFHEDIIRSWHSFLHYFNGKCNFLRQSPTTDVQTDACLVAAGAYFRGDWLYHNFALDTPDLTLLHINYMEVLMAQVFAVFRWAPCWANQHILCNHSFR